MQASISESVLLFLPGELILQILTFLDIQQVLTLRQTCTALAQMTQTRSLWLAFLYQQQASLPLPSHLSSPVEQSASSKPLVEHPTSNLESDVITTHRIAQLWARPRTQQLKWLTPKHEESLLSVEIFLDRWLLCAYSEGLIYLWDLCPRMASDDRAPSVERPSAILDLGSKNWASITTALCPSNEHIVLALTQASIPAITRLYRVQLRHPESVLDQNDFVLLHTSISPVAQIARAIEPALRLIVLSTANSVDIVSVNTLDVSPSSDTAGAIHSRMSLSTRTDDLEELLNGVVASRIMGPYLVIFKSRSIELHPLVTDDVRTQSVFREGRLLKHHLPSVTFRLLSSSDCIFTRERLSFSFLGYDFLQGIFHVNVCVRFTPMLSPGASLDVDCVGVYPMADNIDIGALFPLSSMSTTASDATLMHSGIFGPSTSGAGANASSRGFVSAMSLGPQGKRAVWVERKRGSTVREVLVWSQASEASRGGDGGVVIPRHVAYRVESYDLREDLTHCAIGEVSGRIVLGNRAGDVFVLGLDL